MRRENLFASATLFYAIQASFADITSFFMSFMLKKIYTLSIA